MKKTNQRIKFTISEILGRALNWSFMLVVALFLNVQDYGYFSLIVSLETLLSVIMVGGLDRGAMRFLSDKAERIDRKTVYFSWLLFSLFPVAFVFCIGDLSNVFVRYKVDNELIPVFIAGLFFVAQTRLFCTISRAENRSDYFFINRVVAIILKIALFVFLIQQGETVVVAYLFAMLFSSLVSLAMIPRIMTTKPSNGSVDKKKIKVLYRYSLPFLPHMIAGNLIAFSDRFLLEYYIDASSVGIYSFAYMLGSSISLVYAIVALTYEKELFAVSADYDRVSILQETYYRFLNQVAFLFFIALAIGSYFLADYTELARSEYFLKIMVLVFFSSVFHTIYLKASYYLAVEKKSVYIASSTLISLVINVSSNMILIPRFGIMGAAYSTVISYVLLSLIVALIVRIKTKYRVLSKVTFYYMLLCIVCMGLSYFNIYYGVLLALVVSLFEIKKILKNTMHFLIGKGGAVV